MPGNRDPDVSNPQPPAVTQRPGNHSLQASAVQQARIRLAELFAPIARTHVLVLVRVYVYSAGACLARLNRSTAWTCGDHGATRNAVSGK